ncbi:MAG: translocation/assembly module TamB domain-containing protein [Gemmatimonadota bacterium]
MPGRRRKVGRGRLGRASWAALEVSSRFLGVLLGLALLAAAGALLFVSQTVVGRRIAASYAEDVLRNAVNGEVRVGPILGGNLVSRIHLASFEMATPDGVPFVRLEGVRLAYNPLGFLTGNYRFRRLEAERIDLLLKQDEEGTWNFKTLFPGGDGPSTTRILISDAATRGGSITVRTPWASGLRGAERDSAIVQGLRGDRLWRVRQTAPDRVERVLVLDSLRGRFPLLRLADPLRPLRIELEDVGATADVVTRTLDIRRFDGAVVFRDTIAVDIDRLETPSSALRGRGWLRPTAVPSYRFDLAADPLGFADLQWLPIPVPRTGGGPVTELVIRSPGRPVIVEARRGDVRVEDSRMRGSFVLAVEDPPRFRSMDLTLEPVRIALIDDLLERPHLVDGYLRGTLSGRGPIDLLAIDADLEVRDLEGAVEPSFVHASGGTSVGPPRQLTDMRLTLRSFEPRWSGVVGIPVELGGRVTGRVTFDGFAGGRIEFDADVEHSGPGGGVSRLVGGGVVDLTDDSALDLRLTGDPLSLTLLDPVVPELDLVGEVRGPFSASGRMSDLRVAADLRTPRGLLNFDGRFDLASETKTYDAELVARDIQLSQWARRGPSTRLDVRGRVNGRGTDPETLEATFDLTILPSRFEGARVDSSLLRFTMANGLATADTFAIRTDVGRVDGFGSFGLAEGRSGSLILDLEADRLASWNRWVVPGRNPSRQDTSVSRLFEAFPGGGEGQPEAGSPPDTLAGALRARGVVYGSFADFAFGGWLSGTDVEFGAYAADSVQLTLDVAKPETLDSLVIRASAWNARSRATTADSLFVRWQRDGPVRSDLTLFARRDTSVELGAHALLDWGETMRRARIDRFRARLGDQDVVLGGEASVAYGDSGLSVRGLSLSDGRGGSLEARGIVPDSGSADFDIRLEKMRLENVLQLLDPAPALAGEVDATLRVRGTATSPRLDASLRIADPAIHDLSVPLLVGDYRYGDGSLRVQTALRAEGVDLARVDGTVSVDLALRRGHERMPPNALDLQVEVDSLPIQPLEFAFENLQDVTGFVRGHVNVRGDPGALDLTGSARLSAGEATVRALGIRVREVDGGVEFAGSRAVLDSVHLASSAGGEGFVSGSVDLAAFRNPAFDLDLQASGFRGIERRLASLSIDGTGKLGGDYERPELTGSFRFSDGEIRAERFIRQQQVVDLTDPDVFSLIDTTLVSERRLIRRIRNPFMRNLRMDITLAMGPDLWLRSRTMEVELAGEMNLRMDRAVQDLTAFGTLQLPRGRYRYVSGSGTDLASLYSRQLAITSGTISFVGTPGMDPNLDIHAEFLTRSEQGPLTIFLTIGGTTLSPTLTLSSDPPLPDSDRICYLLFSAPCIGVTTQGGDFAASLLREGLLGTVGSQFSQVLVGGFGVVDYLDVRTTAGPAGTTGPGAETGPFLGLTEVEVGRYLGRRIFLRASQPLGGRLPGASLEWRFRENWSLEARTEDRFRRFSLLSSSSNIDTDRTYGLFLFKDWDF